MLYCDCWVVSRERYPTVTSAVGGENYTYIYLLIGKMQHFRQALLFLTTTSAKAMLVSPLFNRLH